MNWKRHARLACGIVALAASAAYACSGTSQDVFSVGNKAVDSSCTYDSIQAAIDNATCSNGTTIILNQSGNYTNQHFTISGKDITLVGRVNTAKCNTLVAACGVEFPCPVGPLRTIDANNTSGAVLTIRGTSHVTVSHLILTDGKGSNGGGIDFSGHGSLTIDNSTISYNHAVKGGGINFQGDGNAAVLTIGADTSITDNTVTPTTAFDVGSDGGGIRVSGSGAVLNMNAPDIWVSANSAASGKGGGIDLEAGTTTNIGSRGTAFSAAIEGNSAKYGGGIAVTGGGVPASMAFLNLYTTDPMHPVAVDSNTASADGGGIHSDSAMVCAADYQLTRNTAQQGAAIYAKSLIGGVYLNPEASNSNCLLASLGSVPCDASQQCGIVHGNVAQAADGAAMRIMEGVELIADRLDVRANQGGYAVYIDGSFTSGLMTHVNITNCLFADNLLQHAVLLVNNPYAQTYLAYCTFAHDTIASNLVLASQETVLGVRLSVIAEGSSVTSVGVTSGENLTENPDGLSGSFWQATPLFVDVAHGDYRLLYGLQGGKLVSSPGIDYAEDDPSVATDIRGAPRGQLLGNSATQHPRDLGAYEMQGVTDRVFLDTFGDDVRLAN